jgi:hypothetical protein
MVIYNIFFYVNIFTTIFQYQNLEYAQLLRKSFFETHLCKEKHDFPMGYKN